MKSGGKERDSVIKVIGLRETRITVPNLSEAVLVKTLRNNYFTDRLGKSDSVNYIQVFGKTYLPINLTNVFVNQLIFLEVL